MANPKDLQELLSKNDLTIILETNKKAIELQTSTASQNEDVLEQLEDITDTLEKSLTKLDLLDKKIESIDKALYRLQIVLIVGILPIIFEIIKFAIGK